MSNRSTHPSVLTIRELARELGIGISLAYKEVREGRIPSFRVGKVIRIPATAVEQILAAAGRQGGGTNGA